MKLGLIGKGAIAQFVMKALENSDAIVSAILLRPERVAAMQRSASNGLVYVALPSDLPKDIDHVVDCAGHEALREFGPQILRTGFDLTTVSIGALADQKLADRLAKAAQEGNATLRLASGAIGALDALRAANVGTLRMVRYVGRKPPKGWLGSPAESKLDLTKLALCDRPETHFLGTARNAALAYPKNANVAAAVALAGTGFDKTEVELIADPTISANIHEIQAEGDFGKFDFRIAGETLPGNPRTSALAAMSVVSSILQATVPIRM